MAVVEPPPRFAVEPLYGLLGRFRTWSGCTARMSPATETALAQVIEWQLGHPDGTMDECEAWLKAEHEAGRIHVEENAVPGSAGKRARIPEGFVTKKAKR